MMLSNSVSVTKLRPRVAGAVPVGLLQPGAARAERSVGVELDPDQPEPVAVEPGRRPGAGDGERALDARAVGDDPDLEPAVVAGAAHDQPVVGAGAHVGGGGEAVGQHDLLRPLQRLVAGSGKGRRNDLVDELGGGVDEDPGRLAARHLDLAAGGGFGRGGDPGFLHRLRCSPSRHGRRPGPSQTGRSLTAASSSAAVGKRPRPQVSWFQPRPMIQRGVGLAAA